MVQRSEPAFEPQQQAVADWLAAEALRNGGLTATATDAWVFTAGVNAQRVARVVPAVPSAVVKLGGREVLAEAQHLARLRQDERLPLTLRHALPKVYAITPEVPDRGLYGYLIEDLTPSHVMLSDDLLRDRNNAKHGAQIGAALWEFMELAYGESVRSGHADLSKLFVEPGRTMLTAVAQHDPRLRPDRTFTIRRNGRVIQVPPWPQLLDRVGRALQTCAPAPRTFAHGDFHVWNILVPRAKQPAGKVLDVRLLDPNRGVDDALHDVGRLVTSLRYAHIIDQTVPIPPLRIVEAPARVEVEYEVPPAPASTRAAEKMIVGGAMQHLRSHGEREPQLRLAIAVGAALLSDLRQLTSPHEHRRIGAFGSFLEALVELVIATETK